MGRLIGSIKEGVGFIPNSGFLSDDKIQTLEFGEYAIVLANSKKTLELLMECFHPEDAVTIYSVALIHFVQGFSYMKDIKKYYDMSYLSLKFPCLKLGYTRLSKLYANLGRRQGPVLLLEQKLVDASSRQIAVDGHVLGSVSSENDLACKGYKFQKIGESQMNLLMAYDVNTHIPLFSRIYEGGSPDKVSVQDFLYQVELKDMLFIVDSGFYSTENLELFQTNGSSYIIPLAKNLKICKKAVSHLEMNGRFMYQKGKKAAAIEYKDELIDGHRVLCFRDLNEAAAEQANYLRYLQQGKKNYTEERFLELKDFMGLYVLQTSLLEATAEEIFQLYKMRWTIETYYNYFKNRTDCRSLYQQDYYKVQGLAFVMLVSALIHQEFADACKVLKGKSIQDCLLEARMLKANKQMGIWTVSNCSQKHRDLLKALNTEPKIEGHWLHT
ncbi:MAG: transposase [Bacillota bacterium]|nr:transposase [Bacillota bacterium]